MKSNILFIFEGQKTEKVIMNRLSMHFKFDNQLHYICSYGAEIYQLYQQVKEDEFLDTFNLIQERNDSNKKILAGFTREDFAEIYMFFDYDGHATKADDKQLLEMLKMFDDETDKGKLYISYPMVEAVRHINDYAAFKDLIVKCKGRNCPSEEKCKDREDCLKERHYKEIVDHECLVNLKQINKYNKETWGKIIEAHLSKMNFIMYNEYIYPSEIEAQSEILESQIEKYLSKECPKVGVLSAFPMFILDYYGVSKLKGLLQ